MRKRILSIVLVLALCLAYTPAIPKAYAADYEVSDEDELYMAIDGLVSGQSIQLLADIEYGYEISAGSVGENYTIDLNGKSLSLVDNFESEANWTITDSSGNGGTFAVGGDLIMTAGTLRLESGVTVSVNGYFRFVGSTISLSGGSTLSVSGDCELADSITLNFGAGDYDSQFVIGDLTQLSVAAGGDADVLAGKLEGFMRKRYYFTTGLAVSDRSSATAPTSLVLRTWAPPESTTYVQFTTTAKYNGGPQDLITTGEYVPSGVEKVLYGTSTDPVLTGTTSPTETNAGTYGNLAYLVVGNGNYDDIYATGPATIQPATVPFFTAKPQAIQVGEELPSLDAPVEGVDYTVEGLMSPSDLASLTMGYSTAAPADTSTAGEYYDAIEFTAITLAVPGNYSADPIPSQNRGTLTITTDPPVTMNAAPAGLNNLVYDGTDQPLVLVPEGAVEHGTLMYSVDHGVTYSDAIPAGRDAATYEVAFRVEPDTGYAAVDAFSGEIIVEIARAPAVIVEANEHATMTAGGAMPVLYTANGLKGTDALNVEPYWPAGDPDTTVAGGPYDFELNLLGFASGTQDNYEPPYVEVMVPMGQLTVTSDGGGGGRDTTPKESYDFTQPEEGPGSGKIDDENWPWGDRANLSKDAATLYMVLSNNSVSEDEDNPLPYPGLGTEHFLASDDTWVLPAEDPAIEPAEVIDVRVCQDNEPFYYANGDGKVDQSTFGNSDFYTVGVGTGDTKIDYANLKTGDVVSNTSFNGVFVTKLQKSNNPTFDADLAKLKSDTIASFRAFELDHPEVFWLNGSIKLRVLTVTLGGEQTSFIFMTLVDDKGFTMRIAEYAAAGSIEAGIKQRDAAVAAIIAQIPTGASDREKVVNLNKWFTLNNEYNRSADLSSIGFTPHRSLKSLMGNFGINGPVCDGYSRGFKTVCDRLGIPVVLETGTASIGSHSELHMWMSVKVDGTWYGMDTTWNDPIVKGKDGKVSGYENEKYLLVGNDTVVDGAKFGVSHPANKTPGGTTGVLFASLILNPNEIYGYVPVDYDDVNTSDWFYDYVQDVTKLNLMNGTSPNLFSPQGTATRGQIVQILYNIAGQPEVEDVKVEGWFGVPATWAMDKGIVAGHPDGDFHGNDPVTREQLATILWAFEGAPEQSGELSFADADKVSSYAVNAMLWAKKEGIIGGKPGNLADPQGTATRAEIATIFSNYMK